MDIPALFIILYPVELFRIRIIYQSKNYQISSTIIQPKTYIMIVRKTVDLNKPFELTEEEIAMLKALKDRPAVPDEENPELTEEELDRMVEDRRIRLAIKKKFEDERKTRPAPQEKQVVSVRLSNRAIHKARSFGQEYTEILSWILEKVLTDNNILKQFVE